ncbi:MAG: hypothetical protein QW065_05725, partial [Acidilobaceae archaeon]
DNPNVVAVMRQKDSPPLLYVVGAYRVEKRESGKESPAFTEDDVKLVAEQTGASLEEARRALEEAKGDIALAIMKLAQNRDMTS